MEICNFLLGLKICIMIEIVLRMVIGSIYTFLNYEILQINLLFIIKIVYIPVYADLFFYNEYLWQFYLKKYAINPITDRAIFVNIDFALRFEIKYGDTIISMSPTFQGIGKNRGFKKSKKFRKHFFLDMNIQLFQGFLNKYVLDLYLK